MEFVLWLDGIVHSVLLVYKVDVWRSRAAVIGSACRDLGAVAVPGHHANA
jgi:hypothetical protein